VLLLPVLIVTGCAFDVVHVEQVPTRLEAGGEPADGFVLDAEATVNVGAGYMRTLKRGTRWRYIGRIAQGAVYTTADQVLTVEASNIHEAYIVLRSRELVGFYLPVEKTFAPSPNVVALSMKPVPGQP
jgi:hypothetical protein